jgi:hypothetical protein
MQKTIKIIYNEDKKILCGENSINFTSMTISAQSILNLLNYSIGDKYDIEPIDFSTIEENVKDYLEPVYLLLLDIIDKINKIDEDATLLLSQSLNEEKKNLDE